MMEDRQLLCRYLEQEVIADDEVQLRVLVEGERTPETVIESSRQNEKDRWGMEV